MKRTAKIVSISCMSVILVGMISLNVVAYEMRDILNQFASFTNVSVDGGDADYSSNAKVLADLIETEGAVLLENNGVLPLDNATKKINVFGWSSTEWVYCGSGSGRVNNIEKDFLESLSDYGIETNTELSSMYRSFLGNRPLNNNDVGSLHSYSSDFSVLYEPNINNSEFYTDSILTNAKDFSSTAIVVLSRVTGESNDCPKYQYYSNTVNGGNKKTDKTKTYLDISDDERDLLEYVSLNYEDTIVVINSTNTMNLSFLKDYSSIDACVLVGTTGQSSTDALPPLLYGKANFSGRLTDTYAYDLTTNPSFANSGPSETDSTFMRYTNASGLYPADGTVYSNVGNDNARYSSPAFVDYAEDIYIGYKYYETAYYEGVFSSISNSYGENYDGVVQFPFGYGLSYTKFNQEISALSKIKNSSITQSDTIDLTIKVTNTGTVKGKDVVELYLSRPYTQGGIEKPYKELISFGKTAELAPGESEDVTLSVKVSDFASYDDSDANDNGFKGYEIEKGEYTLFVGKNAHEDYTNVAYKVDSDITMATDPVTGKTVTNRFLDTSYDGVAIDGSDSDQDITYLSRSNFKDTFADSPSISRTMSQTIKTNNLYTAKMANDFVDESSESVTYGEDNGLKIYENNDTTELGLALGKDYDDSRWEEVLSQMTQEEQMKLALHGYVHTEAVASIGKPKTTDLDGPAQIGSFNSTVYGYGYPNPTVLAQTFNQELSYQYGKQIGKEALTSGIDGWYAPGLNLHRTAFGGRNYEYYSEDSYLTGIMAAYTIKGSMNMGVYVFAKHFICYDQEIYRDGLYTWVREQNLRENYLKPFRIAIELGGLTGIMTSYNRLGATWTGGNVNLLTDLLEGEWDYKGAVLTDYSDHQTYMNADQALRAGKSMYMDGWLNNGSFKFETTSNTFKNLLRETSKRNLYLYLSAKYSAADYVINGDGDFITVHKSGTFAWWKAILYSVDGVTLLGLGIWSFFVFVKKKKEINVEGTDAK